MNGRVCAALRLIAACCALLLAPAAAGAQLRCDVSAEQESPTSSIGKKIRSLEFEGNASFSDEVLALHVIVTPTDFFRQWLKVIGTTRCLRPGRLASDMVFLRAFYVDQGFPDAVVDTVVAIDDEWVDITFRVTEGRPVIVDSVAITGLGGLDLGDDLIGKLNSRKGGRYSVALAQADVDTIEARMRNAAHPLGVVLRDRQLIDSTTIVEFQVIPGPRTRIGRITINNVGIDGRPAVIDSSVVREVLRFSTGDLYRERALAESERQFYRVGNFLSAEIRIDTSRARTDSVIDVNVTVLEDLMHQFTIEPGAGTLDCLRARAEYTDKAFLGGLNRFDASGQVSKLGWASKWPGVSGICRRELEKDEIGSDTVNYNLTLRLTRPMTFRGGLLPSFSAYTEKRGGYQAYFRTTLIGGSASFSKAITRTVGAQVSYNLEYGHTFAQPTVLCFLFQACNEADRSQLTGDDKRLAILGGTLSRDLRDFRDSTTSGTSMRLDLRLSRPMLGSDPSLSFVKSVADVSWYRRTVGGVLALRLRGGIIGGGIEAPDGAGRFAPPQERLYTGGETSVRGFGQNELGPLIYVTDDNIAKLAAAPDESARLDSLRSLRMRVIPAGGNAMYVGNIEYRLRGPFLPTLQTIFFLDIGRLWTTGSVDASSGNGERWTPGIAVRYFSPIGPIQVNVGYNKYPRPDGPVYLDAGVGSSLVCLSAPGNPSSCPSVSAINPPTNFRKRLTFTVAFPPDF